MLYWYFVVNIMLNFVLGVEDEVIVEVLFGENLFVKGKFISKSYL